MSGDDEIFERESTVETDFWYEIDSEVVGRIGRGALSSYEWAGDDDDGDQPYLIARKDDPDRRFEVEIEVRVTELTPERLAQRQRLVEYLATYRQSKS